MGQARKRRAAMAEFLERHPRCCFCGGANAATTGDHVPGRAIFLDRVWPEGYMFPACDACNAATRLDEMLVAVLARAFPNAETETEEREVRRAIDGLANNWPEMYRKLRATPTQFLASPLNVMNLSAPEVQASIRKWGGKLGLALHYQHTGNIVGAGGGVVVWIQTNQQFHAEGFPRGLVDAMHGAPDLKRSNNSLKDQFAYLYGPVENGRASIITARLRLAIFLHLFVVDDVGVLPAAALPDLVRPFDRAHATPAPAIASPDPNA